MTIYFPDVSNHQPGMSIAGAAACIAKATEGTDYIDAWYKSFLRQAQTMGIPFAAYHWLHAYDVPAQARNAYSIVGPDIPLMIDDEDPFDGLDIDRTLAFVREYRALGGTVTLEYLPHWFWANNGSPDLRPLAEAGLALVSSNYSAPYSDTGPGWDPYGGVAPAIWQYTSSAPFNGVARVDFNGFRGTVDELRDLFHGGDDMTPEQLLDTRITGTRKDGSTFDFSLREFVVGTNEAAWDALIEQRVEADADETRDKAVLAAVQALATAGGVDAAPIVAAVEAVRDEAREQFTELHTELASAQREVERLRAVIAAGERAQADALDSTG